MDTANYFYRRCAVLCCINRDDRKSTIHMVKAFATANGVAFGQFKTVAKSHEITVIPELLSLLEIEGCLVSIDAMGYQTDIAQTILDKGADYLRAVRGNQRSLYKAMKKAISPYTSTDSGARRKCIWKGSEVLLGYR